MLEVAVEAVKIPLKHQLGKLMLGTLVGFAATQLTYKGYDAVLECINNKNVTTK